jgi:hypothetical protein
MKFFRKIFILLALLTLSYLTNIAVNVISFETGSSAINKGEKNCASVSFTNSGFPIRDIDVKLHNGESCGMEFVSEMGDTGIGKRAFFINWLFYFLLFVYLTLKLKKSNEDIRD